MALFGICGVSPGKIGQGNGAPTLNVYTVGLGMSLGRKVNNNLKNKLIGEHKVEK